jgi:hypothetical protein
MRFTCLLVAISAAVPFTASGQLADPNRTSSARTVFSIQPLFEGRAGPRLELERAIGARLTLVAGSRLTMSQVDFISRFPRPASYDFGLRYYARGRAFRGPYAGVYAGYDRSMKGVYADTPAQIERAFLGGTIGYDFVFFRRLIIAPAIGAEFGRPDPIRVIKTWEVHPRLGIGFNFE